MLQKAPPPPARSISSDLNHSCRDQTRSEESKQLNEKHPATSDFYDSDDCDPAGNKTCLFAAVYSYITEPPNGTKLAFLLRGDSAGYVALGLTVDPTMGNTMLFICAKNSSDNGTFVFQTMDRNNKNNKLSPTERRVIDLHGRVTGNVIECEFIVPNVNASSVKSSHDSTFYILLGTGNVDGDTFGPFDISLNSGPKDLYKPPIPPIIIPTFKPISTDNSSGAVQPRAALLLLSVLTLSVLLRA